MPTINELSAVDSLSAADQFPVYSSANGDARKSSLTVLLEFMQENLNLSASSQFTTQYSAPSSTGFSVSISDIGSSIWLVLTPTGGFANGTIVLPPVANVVDKQELNVNCTQSVTTLAISGNGATVTGGPSTLAANAFFRLRFEAATDTWYRVG